MSYLAQVEGLVNRICIVSTFATFLRWQIWRQNRFFLHLQLVKTASCFLFIYICIFQTLSFLFKEGGLNLQAFLTLPIQNGFSLSLLKVFISFLNSKLESNCNYWLLSVCVDTKPIPSNGLASMLLESLIWGRHVVTYITTNLQI